MALTIAVVILAAGWLASAVISTGIAGHHESAHRPEQALRWRSQSPTALTLAASAAVAREDYVEAEAMARRAIARGPLNAPALRMLALSAADKGRDAEANAFMRQASALSLRDSPANTWLLDRALANGDFDEALLRADLIMRRSEKASGAMTLILAGILAEPGGREALARRLAAAPPWRGRFLRSLGGSGNVDQTGALFATMSAAGGPPAIEEVTPLVQRLVAAGQFNEARALWKAVSRASQVDSELVFDGGFDGRVAPQPLTWQPIRLVGGSAALTGTDGAPLGHLQLRHDGFSSSGVMARQLIFLRPGDYVVSAAAEIDEPAGDQRFRLEIGCAPGVRLVALSLSGQPGRRRLSRVSFTVPANHCEAQWLLFRPNTGDRREPVEMKVDDVAIQATYADAGAKDAR